MFCFRQPSHCAFEVKSYVGCLEEQRRGQHWAHRNWVEPLAGDRPLAFELMPGMALVASSYSQEEGELLERSKVGQETELAEHSTVV